MKHVFPIKHEDIPNVWPLIVPYIEDAIFREPRTHELADIVHGIETYKFTPWIIMDDTKEVIGAAITSIEQFPLMRVAVLNWMAGIDIFEDDEWKSNSLQPFAKWASVNGCDVIRIDGREGWSRKLGVKPVSHVCLLKPEDFMGEA